jgi:hypothetical protein
MSEFWSPEAVAKSLSSDENSRSMIEFVCGWKDKYAFENPALSSFAESINRMPPSSFPMATREFAASTY